MCSTGLKKYHQSLNLFFYFGPPTPTPSHLAAASFVCSGLECASLDGW